jgi:hypothetical protein
MHHNVKDLTGKRFGMRTVLRYLGKSYWLCRCDCGNEHKVFTGNIGKTNSCGCDRSRVTTESKTTHGLYGTPEYKTWSGIKRRCFNKNDKTYPRYGGAGITMCARWNESFEAFVEDMGQKPSPEHSIDRLDNSKGYEPGNCRWATKFDQAQNQRTNRKIAFRGETKTVSQWAREAGIHPSLLSFRVAMKWPMERALTQKPRKMTKRQTAAK